LRHARAAVENSCSAVHHLSSLDFCPVRRGQLYPNHWFNNVETVTAEKIGIETTTYVRNIFKYYVSYRLTTEARETKEKLKEQVIPAKK
jgi:hypothetical protein